MCWPHLHFIDEKTEGGNEVTNAGIWPLFCHPLPTSINPAFKKNQPILPLSLPWPLSFRLPAMHTVGTLFMPDGGNWKQMSQKNLWQNGSSSELPRQRLSGEIPAADNLICVLSWETGTRPPWTRSTVRACRDRSLKEASLGYLHLLPKAWLKQILRLQIRTPLTVATVQWKFKFDWRVLLQL